ncbi:MAG: hypothetical protein AAB356_03190, partial [Deltaproteobacteria bacterium]
MTSLTTSFGWAQDAYFLGVKTDAAYGPYVFAIFAREGINMKPTIRSGMVIDSYFSGKDMGEYNALDDIRYEDALLVASKEEFNKLSEQKIANKRDALVVLGRGEEEQQEFENRAYEHGLAALNIENNPEDRAAIVMNGFIRSLLEFRAQSDISEGMLFHIRAPDASRVLLTGEFNNWAKEEG